jgi:hypothetical protein
MARENLHHHRVQRTVLLGLSSVKGYANHTFNEVFVGGRWVRLNDSKLGQNILDAHTFGMLTHVNTFNDLSEIPLAATWGKRYALGQRDTNFPHANPYVALQLSDHFGKYAHIENPDAQEHLALTLSHAYWPSSPECPALFKNSSTARTLDPNSGYVLTHAEEWFPDEPYAQYNVFMKNAAKAFLFLAENHAEVHGLIMGSITNPPEVHEIVIVIPPPEYAKMDPGIEYVLVPQNGQGKYTWKTKGRVTIKRER